MERLFHGRGPWAAGGVVAFVLHAAVLAWLLQESPPAPRPVLPAPMTVELLPFEAGTDTDAVVRPAPAPAAEPPPPVRTRAAAPPAQPLSPPLPPAAPSEALPPTPVALPQAEVAPLPEPPASGADAADATETEALLAAAATGVTEAEALSAGAAARQRPAGARLSRRERDYFAHLSAHLNRRKEYPVEARQARQQGVVVVRFGIDRDGNVLFAEIKQGSGHALLDEATLALLKRVSPLPRIPRSLDRDRLTLSLPIDYSLTTD
ncbi:energy transducer TonB [Silanimonas lenta]|uniref:energy transducer TonB n=1 Tax=Silanimonas lenta TaxID=265429 RepID=UPI0004153B9C|nr:energy transducer TonB [Silanimonas lenta]